MTRPVADVVRRAAYMAMAQRIADAMRESRVVYENPSLPDDQKYGCCSVTMFEAANRARVEDQKEAPLIFICEVQPHTERTDFDYVQSPRIVL